MIRAYQYRLYPTVKQRTRLDANLELCRELYNAALEERIGSYKRTGKGVGRFDQQRQLKEIRQIRPEFQEIRSIVLCEVLLRLDKAFRAFFRRCRAGQKPGFPRFKSRRRFNSLSFAPGSWRQEANRLILGKVGGVKIRLHRPLPKARKTCVVKKNCGAWYAVIFCEVEPQPLPISDKAIGIDVGLESFATLSNGEIIDNPRWFQCSQRALRRRQRRIARRAKRSHRWRKACLLAAKLYEHIRQQRRDFQHKLSRKLVNEYGVIAVEDLNVKGLAGGMLAMQVSDAGWSQFIQKLSYKAAEAGRKLIAVNPSGTSQTCLCGARVSKRLSDREHICTACGLASPRDLVSAQLILQRGLESPSGANVGAVRPSVAREVYAT